MAGSVTGHKRSTNVRQMLTVIEGVVVTLMASGTAGDKLKYRYYFFYIIIIVWVGVGSQNKQYLVGITWHAPKLFHCLVDIRGLLCSKRASLCKPKP